MAEPGHGAMTKVGFGIGDDIFDHFSVAVAGGVGRPAVVSLVDEVHLESEFRPNTGVRGPIVAHSEKAVQYDKRTAGSDNFAFEDYRHNCFNRLKSLALRAQLELVAVALDGVFKSKIERVGDQGVTNRYLVELGQ
jgi:hypothetical protein